MASNPTLKRLMKEAHELSAASPSPSPYFYAHPVSDSDFFDWHFTLAGPPSSPYEEGIYHGRIVLPPTYPLRPPSFRFLTPSGRFEVNREICLSISGHHEETWQPAWGIRTALIALRSYMDIDAAGQVGGMEAKEEVRREWARRSRTWKCVGCGGGKTNEEVLEEWREVCRSKGVEADEGDNTPNDTPEGLRFGYKDEQGRVQDTSAQTEKTKGNLEPGSNVLRVSKIEPSSTGSPSTEVRQRGTDIPSSAQTSALHLPSAAGPASATSPVTAMRRYTPSLESTAWMDKAIPILAIALVIMVIKSWILPLVS